MEKVKYTNLKTGKYIIVEFSEGVRGGCHTLAGAAEMLGADTCDGSFTEEDKKDPKYVWWEDIEQEEL